MTEEKTAFDPYHVWLGIPARDQPPHHYRLLGLDVYEENADVIDAAANRQSAYLHSMASGPHRRECQKLLNEISAARVCLLNQESKRQYDLKLKQMLSPAKPEKVLPPVIVVSTDPPPNLKQSRTVKSAESRQEATSTNPVNSAWKTYAIASLIVLLIMGGVIYFLSSNPEEQKAPEEQEAVPTQPAFSFE